MYWLPATLEAYLNLPRAYASVHQVEGSKTPSQVLLDQLSLLEAKMNEISDDISRNDIGFGSDDNAGVVMFADGSHHELEKMTKREMADRILDLVVPRLKTKK